VIWVYNFTTWYLNPVYSLSQENIEDEHLAVIMLIKSS
jgi:hypothetical protein